MTKFDADDEHAGHARLLAAIRAEQVQDQPEPEHEAWTEVISNYGGGIIHTIHCCDWHQHHRT